MNKRTRVAIIGEFQDGKSTLINSLMRDDVAQVGYGTRTTRNVCAYDLPGSDCTLLDTPGFNLSQMDNDCTRSGTRDADAFLLMLGRKVISPSLIAYVQEIIVSPDGFKRPLIPIINEYGSSVGIGAESIAGLRDAGVNPILFGEKMPCIDARVCGKESAMDDYSEDDAKLAYLFGIAPRCNPSPITRICAMLRTVQQRIKI